MDDLTMTRLCADAMGWKYLGAVGVELPEGMRGSEADRLYPGKLWCLSGGNEWWRHPEGNNVCGRCCLTPDPLHDDAEAFALVKKLRLEINSLDAHNWYARQPEQQSEWTHADTLNRAIVECVAKLQAKIPT